MTDILFKTPEYVFSYRVGGVLLRDGRALLTRDAGTTDGYAIPGGHVAFGETAEQALRREFQEELRADIRVDRLMATGEIFFPWGDKPCHQISLYYAVTLIDPAQVPAESVFHGFDDMGEQRISLDFCWVPLDELDGLTVYPPQLVPLMRGEAPLPAHFVYKEA